MSAKHTPGPWQSEVRDGEIQIWADRQEGGGRHRECVAVINGQPNEKALADAELIAAAPKLLAALQATLSLVESDYQSARVDGNWPDVAPIMEQVREAIAKYKPA